MTLQAAIKAKDYVQAMARIVELKVSIINTHSVEDIMKFHYNFQAQKPHNKTLQRLQDQVLILMNEEDKPAGKVQK